MSSFIELNTRMSHNWHLTWNNPPSDAFEMISELFDEAVFSYIVAGWEVAPETGTEHLQMFVQFVVKKRLQSVRKLFPHTFASPMATTVVASITYCKKDNNYCEWGVPISNTNTIACKWAQFIDTARAGNLDELDSGMFVRYYNTAKKLQSDMPDSDVTTLDIAAGIWVYGAPNCGKTTTVMELFPSPLVAFNKSLTKWWDGYRGQDVVVIDEMPPKIDDELLRNLKIWADRHIFTAELKGSSIQIRPSMIVVTSNWTIEQSLAHHSDDTHIKAMLKRYYPIHFSEYRKYNKDQLNTIIQERVYPTPSQGPIPM